MTDPDVIQEQKPEVFSDILKKANVGLLLYDGRKRLLYANQFMYELTGYTPSEILENDFFALVLDSSEEVETYREKLDLTGREPPYDFDLAIQKKGGEKIDLNITTSLFENEVDPYLLLIVQNITNRKAFERVIVSSFDKFIQTTIELDTALKKIRDQSRVLENYKDKIQNELMIASSVQRAIIPQQFPSTDSLDIYGVSLPCSELGGDYLDIFRLERNRLGILLADVSGHGVHAALISAMAKVYFVNYSRLYNDPAHVLARVNADLGKIFKGTGFYLSAVYSVLDLDTMHIRTATAGHENPLCYMGQSGEMVRIGNLDGGAILGSLGPSEVYYKSATNQLEIGSTVVYYTDGIPEARNKRNEFFGDDRLENFLKENYYLSAQEFADKILEDTDRFYEGAEPNDDRTLIVLHVTKMPTITAAKDRMDYIREHFNTGQGLLDRSKYKDAIEEFEKILNLDPESFRAHHFLGRALSGLKRFEEAEDHFRQVVELNPDYYQGYYQLGIVLYNQGKFRHAHRVWTTLRQKAGEFKKVNDYLEMVDARLNGNGD